VAHHDNNIINTPDKSYDYVYSLVSLDSSITPLSKDILELETVSTHIVQYNLLH